MIRKAFYLLVFTAPIVYTSIHFPALAYWLIGGIAFPVLINLTIGRVHSRIFLIFIMLTSGFVAFSNILLAGSYYLQGTGFNEQFFYHMEGAETYKVAREQFSKEFFGSILYVLACSIFPAILPSAKNNPYQSRSGIALFLASMLCYAPGISFFYFLHSSYLSTTEENDVFLIEQGLKDVKVQALKIKPKNLILIYAESLEQLYFDHSLFGDLLPQLGKLKSQSINFSNIHQVGGTGWTIAGIISSQCGFPLKVKHSSSANVSVSAVEHPFPNSVCMGDILNAYGYSTVYMSGTSHRFAGMDNFFKNHGYQELQGKEILSSKLEDPEYQIGWGLYDDSLLTFAKEKLDSLDEQSAPYLLTLTTMDTHGPDGHLSASCNQLENNNSSMKQAFYCSDQLLAKFINMVRARKSFDNTLVVLVSDHLTHQTSLSDTLREKQGKRRLTFFLIDNETNPQTLDVPGTHFDIGPTILTRMGIPGFKRLNMGQSLLHNEKGFWFEGGEKFRAIANDPDLLGFDLKLEGNITFSLKRPEIIINKKRFIPSKSGFEFRKIIFAMVFNDSLEFEGFVNAENSQDLKEQVGDRLIIALSSEPEFNQTQWSDNKVAKYYYYIGKLDTPKPVTGGLWWETTIPKSEIQSLLENL